MLSLHDQQKIALLRAFIAAPQFVLLDRMSTTLNDNEIRWALRLLSRASIAYFLVDGETLPSELYDAVLRFEDGGAWTWRSGAAVGIRQP